MNVKASSEQLIHEILTVIIRQILPRVDNSMHVCFHQVSNDVDVLVAGGSWWFLNINQPNNVLMVEEF